ncbi:hypothetical protein [Candidatus Poriferisodalis sp.]
MGSRYVAAGWYADSPDAIGSVARYGSGLDGQADGLVMGVLRL